MRVSEVLEVLKTLPGERELDALVPVVCGHCRRWGIAFEVDSDGMPIVRGWWRCLTDPDLDACSPQCADALGDVAVDEGRKRHRWRFNRGGP